MTKRHWLGMALLAVGAGMNAGVARADAPAANAAAKAAAEKVAGEKSEDEDEPKFLATMTVAGGVSYDAAKHKDCKPLSFKTTERITVFTERPTRQAQSMLTSDFVKSWSDAYGSSAPNAHLQLFNRQGEMMGSIVHLKVAPTWNEQAKTVTFPDACFLQINEDKQARKAHSQFEFGVLFIDAAKLFHWNSCYSTKGTALGGLAGYAGCLEQWGSYAARCPAGTLFLGSDYAPGKRCKNVCKVGTCTSGCFSDYSSYDVVFHETWASAYRCK